MLTKDKNKCFSPNPGYIYDEACLDILTDRKVNISAQYLECERCKFQEWAAINGPSNNTSLLVNTKYQLQFRAEFDNASCTYVLYFHY